MKQNYIFLFSVLLVACTNIIPEKSTAQPNDIIEQEQMVCLLTDLRLVEAASQKINKNSPEEIKATSAAYHFVFEKYGINDSIFKANMDYYNQQPEQLEKIYEKVHESISRMQFSNDSLINIQK